MPGSTEALHGGGVLGAQSESERRGTSVFSSVEDSRPHGPLTRSPEAPGFRLLPHRCPQPFGELGCAPGHSRWPVLLSPRLQAPDAHLLRWPHLFPHLSRASRNQHIQSYSVPPSCSSVGPPQPPVVQVKAGPWSRPLLFPPSSPPTPPPARTLSPGATPQPPPSVIVATQPQGSPDPDSFSFPGTALQECPRLPCYYSVCSEKQQMLCHSLRVLHFLRSLNTVSLRFRHVGARGSRHSSVLPQHPTVSRVRSHRPADATADGPVHTRGTSVRWRWAGPQQGVAGVRAAREATRAPRNACLPTSQQA